MPRSRYWEKSHRSAFTLVELLVVIAIIGILVSLLLPAVQSAREAARRTQCSNQIRQLALATLQHEQTHGHFPTGGWGWGWLGDPDRGAGKKQTGGWIYNILPYLEEQTLYTLPQKSDPAARRLAYGQMYATPLPALNCPSRRAPVLYPYTLGDAHAQFDKPVAVGRGDYAMNAGSKGWCELTFGPRSYEDGDSPGHTWNDMSEYNGISYERSLVKQADITDGTSHTYLIGERNIMPDHYQTGLVADDNSGLYTGYENDNYRSTLAPPVRDRAGMSLTCQFGSAHATVWQMAYCDGAIHTITYEIDATAHLLQGDRGDGQVIGN